MTSRIATASVLGVVMLAGGLEWTSGARRAAWTGSVTHVRAAQASDSVWAGVYTDEQAKRGQALYLEHCAECHFPDLVGGDQVAPLTGGLFMSNWNGLSVGDLLERIRISMPQDNPGRVSRQEKADIVAYILKFNGFPPGQFELPRDAEMAKQIRFEMNRP